MNQVSTRSGRVAPRAAVAACLCCAAAILAQGAPERDRVMAGLEQPARSLVKAETLLGAEVRDRSSAEKLGAIKDLGIDARTGTVLYAVVSSGGVLGVGGKEQVVPFDVRALDAENRKVTLNLTKDEFEKAPVHDEKNREEYHRRFDKASAGSAKGGKGLAERTIKGKVSSVDRSGGEVVVGIVGDDKSQSGRISLGADSVLKSHACEPKEGDAIEVIVLDTAGGERPPGTLTAVWIRCDHQDGVQLRDASGRAEGHAEAPCCVLASAVDDAKVVCGREKVGSVGDVLCDTQGNCLSFVTLTTSDLGEKATWVIPWRAVRMDQDKALYLRVSKEQMKNAPRLVRDANGWTDPAFLRRVDDFYATLIADPSRARSLEPKSTDKGKDR
jgi:uncharacterized protein YrrD